MKVSLTVFSFLGLILSVGFPYDYHLDEFIDLSVE